MDSCLTPDIAEATSALENVTYAELAVGQSAGLVHTVTQNDIALFATVSGDVNPAHLDEAYAGASMFKGIIAHGMLGGAFVSSVLGTRLPGPGTIYVGQQFRFLRPVRPGDVVTATVTVKEKLEKNRVILACTVVNAAGKPVIEGDAEVIAPSEKIRWTSHELPGVQLIDHHGHAALMARCAGMDPLPVAVVHPCDEVSLRGAAEAAAAGLIDPVLVGPEEKIRAVADAHGIGIAQFRIVDAAHSHESAERAVALVRAGEAGALMKGSLHSDELLAAVVRKEGGLRTARRVSHAFLMFVPSYRKPLIITDAAINIQPTLSEKLDICQNAIDLARSLGVETPKVAVLSAVETINEKIPSTMDAAALTLMASRGQIRGGIVDGPLAFDNAISRDAAATKGIQSPVAGDPDILLVPDLVSGNMLAKQLTFLANADAAGVVLGAKCPIILTSRADSVRTRLASCAVAVLAATKKG
ncbi:bifunctional enoyl-CoA hydratase/phosphate acetyltransferase [Azospirillum sp. SYSU D00513]|uniref:bifunctional enoyl-CoA hydratase/phosphate acetyltransferase n=1 Tax=Azospirillum sp. SYSU D00513 TaxID=2812561 RepID=UPI001FFFDFE8|nr:bifunctional enoyl-CoA hydratase/phosphate acetyltransferase [Azospirillum sp. SYSU D00513]